jgi:ABC-2 type transport system permease protein
MVAQLLRLRVDLLAGAFRGGTRRTVLVVLATLAALALALWAATVAGSLRDVDVVGARGVLVPVGALALLGCTVVAFVLGSRDQLDPRRYSVFGIGRRDLAVGLGLAGLVGVPVLAVAVLAVGQVAAWDRGAGTTLVAVVAAVLAVATAALLIRVAGALGSRFVPRMHGRTTARVVAVVVVVLLVPVVALLLGSDRVDPAAAGVQRLAAVAGWTPWGAVWAAPADAAAGHDGTAALRVFVAVAVVALLALAWWALVGTLLETVDRAARTHPYPSLGWFDALGATPLGAVAARALTYWVRDPRYRSSYVILLFVPLVVVPLGVAGMPWHWTALVPLPLMAMVAGFLPHNDVSYDNTAVWLHVSSGAPGWTDRLGRLTPLLVVGVPVLVLGAYVSSWLYGDAVAVPLLTGVSLSALLGGLGLSSVVSVAMPYPTVRPGDHPFQQPQAAGSTAVASQVLMVVGILLCMVPAGWYAVRTFLDGHDADALVSLWLGIGVGVVVLVLGVLSGGLLFDRRGPDLLAAAQRN